MAYAHSRGVLHRDLKPGNVMLGPYGETLVVDWGLAKPIGRPGGCGTDRRRGRCGPSSGSGLTPTQMGAAIGTPAYMSPEQAAGRLDELGPASDVYSLGAMLYSLLTGRVAVRRRGARGGAAQGPARATSRRRGRSTARSPPALEAVCLKAMAREPAAAIASPRALADDVEHWLADEPVAACASRCRSGRGGGAAAPDGGHRRGGGAAGRADRPGRGRGRAESIRIEN